MVKPTRTRDNRDTGPTDVPIWVADLPLRQWIEGLPVNGLRPPAWRWAEGKVSKTMLASVPRKIAEAGRERITLLCRVYVSQAKARRKLVLRGRRVKYTRPGVPDHKVNVLRRIEEDSMSLKDEGVQEEIMQAARANDVRWFIRLAKALETGRNPKKRAADFFPDRIDRVANFLVRYWFSAPVAFAPPLCHLTDQALADVCKCEFPTASPTMLSVRQWRKRLGLLRPGKPIVKHFP